MSLNVMTLHYIVQVQTILRFSDMGPYSDPIKYTVQGMPGRRYTYQLCTYHYIIHKNPQQYLNQLTTKVMRIMASPDSSCT